jgi:hypothetical protein
VATPGEPSTYREITDRDGGNSAETPWFSDRTGGSTGPAVPAPQRPLVLVLAERLTPLAAAVSQTWKWRSDWVGGGVTVG